MKAANPQIAAGAEKKKRRKSLRKIGKRILRTAELYLEAKSIEEEIRSGFLQDIQVFFRRDVV